MEHGILVRDPKKLRQHYMSTLTFKLDCLSILPLDLFYFACGLNVVVLRLPRLFRRLHRLLELRRTTEMNSRFPNVLRLCFLVAMVLLIFHWNACFYFRLSRWIGLGSDSWVSKRGAVIRHCRPHCWISHLCCHCWSVWKHDNTRTARAKGILWTGRSCQTVLGFPWGGWWLAKKSSRVARLHVGN